MRKLSVLALLLVTTSFGVFAQESAPADVPDSSLTERETLPPIQSVPAVQVPAVQSSLAVITTVPAEPAYQYTPYKIDSVFRTSPFAVIAVAGGSEVKKDARGLLWTYTNFKVLQPVKGNFENNAFALRVVGGAQQAPLLNEYLYTGGLDLGFAQGKSYFMFIDGITEDKYPIVTRQHVYAITGEQGSEVISDFKGGTLKIKKADGAVYAQGEPVLVSDFLAALKKVK